MNQMKGDVEHGLWMEEVDVANITGYRTGARLADRPCTIKGQKECVWPAKAMFALLEGMATQVQNDQTFPDNVVALKDYLDD